MRASMQAKLDRWEAQAEALEAQLGATKEKSLDRLEKNKQALASQIDDLSAKLDRAQSLGAEKRQKIRSDIDHLRVQLALGKADTRDAFTAQKHKINLAINKLDASLDREFDAFANELVEDAKNLVKVTDQLSAEMDATLMQFALDNEVRQDLAAKKDEIATKVQAFKQNVQQKRKSVADKVTDNVAEMERELSEKADDLANYLKPGR
jgi:archaellum component FlaC